MDHDTQLDEHDMGLSKLSLHIGQVLIYSKLNLSAYFELVASDLCMLVCEKVRAR